MLRRGIGGAASPLDHWTRATTRPESAVTPSLQENCSIETEARADCLTISVSSERRTFSAACPEQQTNDEKRRVHGGGWVQDERRRADDWRAGPGGRHLWVLRLHVIHLGEKLLQSGRNALLRALWLTAA